MLDRNVKKNQYDLAKCVRKFEKKLTPEYCKKYADDHRNVIHTVNNEGLAHAHVPGAG